MIMRSYIKRIILIAAAALVVTAGILTWSWFHVDGRELDFLNALPEDCTAVVTVYDWDETQQELELSKEQIHQILDLLRETSYRRDTSAFITGSWRKNYHIFITFTADSEPGYLYIVSSGDYAIRITSSLDIPFAGDFLHIRNQQWQETLDTILSSQ